MSKEEIERLLSLIEQLVNIDKPWRDKRQMVLDVASEQDRISIEEFCTWFEVV